MRNLSFKGLLTLVACTLVIQPLYARNAAAEVKSPAAIPIHFMSFNVVGLCVSGNNNDRYERAFVDSFAVWTCSHYLHPIFVTNGSSESGKQLGESDLIAANTQRIVQFFRKTEKKRIDIYLFGHSNDFAKPVRNLLDTLNTELGYPVEVRFVYNSGCYNFDNDKDLQDVAKGYVGHKGIDYGPVYSPILLEQWFSKMPIGAAVKISNAAINHRPFTTSDVEGVRDFLKDVFDRKAKEDNDPKGYLTGNPGLVF